MSEYSNFKLGKVDLETEKAHCHTKPSSEKRNN